MESKIVMVMMGWDSVFKLGAFGVLVMVTLSLLFYFIGNSYDSFWLSIILIVMVLFVIVILVSWRAMKRVVTEYAS